MFLERRWKSLVDNTYASPTYDISGIKLCSDENGHQWLAITIFPDNTGVERRSRFAWLITGRIDKNPLSFSDVCAGNIAREITDEEREEIADAWGYDPSWIGENVHFDAGWRRKHGIWLPFAEASLSVKKKFPVTRTNGEPGYGTSSFSIPFPVERIAEGMEHLTRSMLQTPFEYLQYAREMDQTGAPIRLPCDPILASCV